MKNITFYLSMIFKAVIYALTSGVQFTYRKLELKINIFLDYHSNVRVYLPNFIYTLSLNDFILFSLAKTEKIHFICTYSKKK